MNRMLQRIGFLCVCLLIQSFLAVHAYDFKKYPDYLTDWKAWLLDAHPDVNCVHVVSTQAICALPSVLKIDVALKSGTFMQQWDVLKQSYLPLPYYKDVTPFEVKDERGNVLVIHYIDDKPFVLIEPGSVKLKGKFAWDEIPMQIQVPHRTAKIAVTLLNEVRDAEFVPRNGAVSIMPNNTKTSQESNTEEAVGIQVFRLFQNDLGFEQKIKVVLDYKGPSKQIPLNIGKIDHFALSSVDSPLEIFQNFKSDIVVLAKPGRWVLTFTYLSKETAYTFSAGQTNNSHNEIWLFNIDQQTAQFDLAALTPVTSKLYDIPPDWSRYGAYQVKPESSFSIQKRNYVSAKVDDKLTLKQQVWLSPFDNKWVYLHEISGKSEHELLTLNTAVIERAHQHGEFAPIVTHQNLYSVVVPEVNKNIQIISTQDAGNQWDIIFPLTVNGWDADFQAVDMKVNLPVGWLLLSTDLFEFGTGSLFESIEISSLFLILILVFIARSIWPMWVVVCFFVFLILSHGFVTAPFLTWLPFLIFYYGAKKLKLTKLQYISHRLAVISLIVVLGWSISFMYMQFKQSIYPLVEPVAPVSILNFEAANSVFVETQDRPLSHRVLKSASMEMVRSSNDEVPPKAISTEAMSLNIGRGEPQWQSSVFENAFGEVLHRNAEVRLVALNPVYVACFRLFMLLLLACVLWRPVRSVARQFAEYTAKGDSVNKTLIASVLLMLILPFTHVKEVEAATEKVIPDHLLLKEYERRLLEERETCPSVDCFSVTDSLLQIDDYNLYIELSVHVSKKGLFPLPLSKQWVPIRVLINKKSAETFVYENDKVYLVLPSGVNTISMTGNAQLISSLSLDFDYKLRNLKVHEEGWMLANQANSLQKSTFYFEHPDRKQTLVVNTIPVDIAPHFFITRSISLADKWHVSTSIRRMNAFDKNFKVSLPRLNGEILAEQNSNITMSNGVIEIEFSGNAKQVSFTSIVAPADTLKLPAYDEHLLQYSIENTPFWEITLAQSYLSIVEKQSDWFYKWVSQKALDVVFDVSARKFWSDTQVSIDRVNVTADVQQKQTLTSFLLDVSSTGYQSFVVDVPPLYIVKHVWLNEQLQTEVHAQKIKLQLKDGFNTVKIDLIEEGVTHAFALPALEFSAQVYNLTVDLVTSGGKWLLFGQNHGQGANILFLFNVICALGFLLLLHKISIIRVSVFHLLLLAVSIVFIPFVMWVGFLLLISLIGHFSVVRSFLSQRGKRFYNFVHVLLFLGAVGFIVILFGSIYMLFWAIPSHYIETMTGYLEMSWYFDAVGVSMPALTVYMLPNWIYKICVLSWAFGLAVYCLSLGRQIARHIMRTGVWYNENMAHEEHPQLIFQHDNE